MVRFEQGMSSSMRTRTFRLIAFLSLVFQLAPLCASSPKLQLAGDYEAFFRKHITQEKILGAAFVVVSGDRIIRVGTIGHTDTSASREIDENTAFRVASVSKTFAAGLTGVLVTEGEFHWDDPVTRYVPDFRIDGDSNLVMIRHLLGQSTGLMPHAYDNLIEDGVDMERIQKQFRKLSYICSPGHCYSYQNSVFSMIEPVIEEVTSQSYAELMEQKIFRPLDMKTASVGYQAFVSNPNHAEPHVLVRSGRWKTVKVLPNYYRVAPAAGVNASALDMGKWLMAQLGSHPEVLNPEVIAALTRPRVKTRREIYRRHWKNLLTEAHYGLGWRIYQLGEHQIAYHSGWVSGFRADVAWSEEHDLGFAILLNAEANSINELTTTFWEMAFTRLGTVAHQNAQKALTAAGRTSP
jgi:beta-lactamase class C